jgi:TRAP-type uncharacterized transport system substrate-binding protein
MVIAGFYAAYRLIDPLPPRHFAIAAGFSGTPYDNFARQYAGILSRHGVELEIRNTVSTINNLDLLRNASAGVQAALMTFGFTQSDDAHILYSLGGIFDAPIFIFYKSAEPITLFAQFRGKRLSIGLPGTSLRSHVTEILKAADVTDIRLVDLDYAQSVDALLADEIEIAIFPSQLDGSLLQTALAAPGVRLMSVAHAESIAKLIPGLKRVILWRGLISLSRDIPDSDIDLLAFRSRVLVRNDLHPALQYLLLEAMREVHTAPGPFNRFGEFPAEQPNDLPLSPTAEAFYRSGPTFWQRYTSFWFTSLANRVLFFVVPVLVALVPVLGFAVPFVRRLQVRRIDRLHRALGKLERDHAERGGHEPARYQQRLQEISSAVRALRVASPFEADLHRLRIHLRMVQEDIGSTATVHGSSFTGNNDSSAGTNCNQSR